MTTVLETGPSAGPELGARWRRGGLGYVLVVALSAVAGFAFLGRSALYLDETVSTTLARLPWHRFTHLVVHQEANQALYYLLLRGWIGVGQGEFALRAPSVIATTAAVAVLVFVAHELFGRRVALVCGVLLAVDPLVVELAQDVRGYALSLLLVSASSALFVRGIRRSARWVTWGGYVVLAALAAYTNFWAALVPLGHAVSLAFVPPGRVPWRRLVPSAVGLVVLLAPLGLLIHSNDSSGKYNWASGTAAGQVFAKVRAHVPHAVIDLAALVVVAAVVWLVVLVRRRARTASVVAPWPVMFAVSWLVVPLGAVVLLSFVYKPLLVVRYLVVFFPPAVMLVALGLARLSRRLLVAGLAVLLAVSGVGLASWYRNGWGEDWRGALDTIAARSVAGDGVVVFPAYMRIPFEWYLRDHPAAERRLQAVYPSLGFEVDPLRYDLDVTVSSAAVAAGANGHARVWLVLSQADLYPARKRAVVDGLGAAGLSPARTFTFAGVGVVEYVSPRGAAR